MSDIAITLDADEFNLVVAVLHDSRAYALMMDRIEGSSPDQPSFSDRVKMLIEKMEGARHA